MSNTTDKFSPEMRARAVRMVFNNEGQHGSRSQFFMSITAKTGWPSLGAERLIKQAAVERGKQPGVASAM